jgi:tRNA 2-(methylsulfanyl)-N6-isopentenyladenosine37 hydroxylase
MKKEISEEIIAFLGCQTPQSWLEEAAERIPDLLIDHAQCEKKAASSAMQLMFRYPEDEELANAMSRLAREELRHFEQVLKIMQDKGVADRKQSAARYASELKEHIRKTEPGRLVDSLIVGAFIEARSCERFAGLVPFLDDSLALFYGGLLESEGRHYQSYLALASCRWMAACAATNGTKLSAPTSSQLQSWEAEFEARIAWFRNIERQLIESVDNFFRFHSGVPGWTGVSATG